MEEKQKPEEERPEEAKKPDAQPPSETPEEAETLEETPSPKTPEESPAPETPEAPPAKPEPMPPEEAEEPNPPEESAEELLRQENSHLKLQLEALKLGLLPDVIEDAVTLAESAARRDGVDVAQALSQVVKKYPAWKASGATGGIKIGADLPEGGSQPKPAPASKRWNRTNYNH